MADKHFEQQVKDRMEEFKLSPSAPVWMNIEAQLKKDKRRRRLFFLLFTGVLLSIGSLYYYNHHSSVQPSVAVQKPTSQVIPGTSQTNSDIHSAIPAPINHSNLSSTSIKTDADKPVTGNNAIPSSAKNHPVFIAQQSKSPAAPTNTINQSLQTQDAEPLLLKIENRTNANLDKPVAAAAKSTKTEPSAQVNPLPTAVSIPVKDSAVIAMAHVTDTVPSKKMDDDTERMVDTSSSVPIQTAHIVQTSKKWQGGFMFNLGLSAIRESPFPSQNFQSDSRFSTPNSGTSGGPSTIVVNEYSVRNNMQWGAGYSFRKPVLKHTYFSAGIQYLYSSFNVLNRQQTQVFSSQMNSFQTIAYAEQKQTYHFHYAVIPLELQWQIAKTQKGIIRFSTGVQNQFRITGSKNNPSFITASFVSKAAFYQPVLSAAPLYEWRSGKADVQVGWYVQYGLGSVYSNSKNYWWQSGVRFQYLFRKNQK